MTKNNLIIKAVLVSGLFLSVFVFVELAYSQPNVVITSVSPGSAIINTPLVISGVNLNKCSPPPSQTSWDFRCNVQFHDIESRRHTISGTEAADLPNTTVSAWVPDSLCPGTYLIRFGEVYQDNWSNTLPFTILPGGTPVDGTTGQPLSCRFITSINPGSGFVGSSIVISGQNLDANIHFYDLPSGVAVASVGDLRLSIVGSINAAKTQVTFNVPAALPVGGYTVRVGPNQDDLSNGVPFNVSSETKPPIISNVRIQNITTSGANVLWDTNEPADSQVEFCRGYTRCGVNTALDSSLKTSHAVSLTGLLSSTNYYVWVKSKDASGNAAILGYFIFRTTTPSSTPIPSTPPNPLIISNVQISNITYYSVTVSWDTNRPADGAIVACTNSFYCSILWAVDPALTTSHSLTLKRLKPNTDYYIWMSSKDASRVRGLYTTPYFKTQQGLALSGLTSSSTSSSMTVTWDTNYPADSLLIVCRFLIWCYGANIVYEQANVLSHSLTAIGLKPNTNYYYYVVSKDQIGYRIYDSDSGSTLP